MTVRTVEGDEHYGMLGLGSMLESAAATFSQVQCSVFYNPDIIIKPSKTRSKLEIDIQDIFVWDNREYVFRTTVDPDLIGGEDKNQEYFAIITKENSSDNSGNPTSDVVGQGTHPGGQNAAVTGDATAIPPIAVGEEAPAFEAFAQFIASGQEQGTDVGTVQIPYTLFVRYPYAQYSVDGHSVHHLATAAHYNLAIGGEGVDAAAQLSLGADVRRMTVDLTELLFDRDILLSILDALSVQS